MSIKLGESHLIKLSIWERFVPYVAVSVSLPYCHCPTRTNCHCDDPRPPILQEVLEVPGQEVFEVAESPRLLEDSGTEQEFLWDAIFQHQRRWQRRHWFRLSSRQNKTCPRKNLRLGCRQTVHIESLSRGLYVRVNKTFLRFGWMNVSASILCFGMCLSCCKRSTSLGLLNSVINCNYTNWHRCLFLGLIWVVVMHGMQVCWMMTPHRAVSRCQN